MEEAEKSGIAEHVLTCEHQTNWPSTKVLQHQSHLQSRTLISIYKIHK